MTITSVNPERLVCDEESYYASIESAPPEIVDVIPATGEELERGSSYGPSEQRMGSTNARAGQALDPGYSDLRGAGMTVNREVGFRTNGSFDSAQDRLPDERTHGRTNVPTIELADLGPLAIPVGAFVLVIGVLGGGCGSSEKIDPDRPFDFTNQGYDLPDAGSGEAEEESESEESEETSGSHSETGTAEECVEEECAGVIDEDRSTPEEYFCLEFEEVADEVGLTTSGGNNGVSLVDYDGDGRTDLYLLKNGVPNEMWRNTKAGFVEVSADVGLDVGGDSQDAAWNDFDDDGDIDLALVGSNGTFLYENIGGTFVRVESPRGFNNTQPGKTGVWIGNNFLLGTENGLRFYVNEGDGYFGLATYEADLDDPGDTARIKVADYDGDGNDDSLVVSGTGRGRLFRQEDDGQFTSVEESLGLSLPVNSTDADWVAMSEGDLPSLYLTNVTGGNRFLVNQQDGTFVERAAEMSLRDAGPTMTAACGDFMDEEAPAFFLGRWQQENLLYIPIFDANGDIIGYRETASPLGMATVGPTIGAEWFDFDNDTDADLDLVVVLEDGIELHRNNTRWIRRCPEDDE